MRGFPVRGRDRGNEFKMTTAHKNNKQINIRAFDLPDRDLPLTGFSVIELTIVAAIIGLITAITLANFPKFNRELALRREANKLALALRKSQTYALAVREFNFSYTDEQGKAYSYSDLLAVLVGEKPKVSAYIKKSTVQQAGENGKITLELANTGSTDLKFLELTLLPSEDYKLITPSSYFYLGDVDSDDTESEEIEVYVKEDVQKLKLPVKLKYADANNQPYQQQFDLELQMYSTSELKKFGVISKSNAWTYILVVVWVLFGALLYRRYRKNPEGFSREVKSFWLMLTGKVNGKK